MKKIKILFVSRTYPPVIGGMEKMSYHLIKEVAKLDNTQVTAIVNRRGKKHLPIFFPAALFKVMLQARKYDILHLSDAVLTPIGDMAKMTAPKLKVVCTVHGLDLTYGEKNSFYRKFNLMGLPFLDRVIAVSRATAENAEKLGAKPEKIRIIPNGIDIKEVWDEKLGRKELLDWLGKKDQAERARMGIKQAKLKPETIFLLTLGRLSKRKGISWFIDRVLPKIDPRVVYLIAGGGKEAGAIKRMIGRKGLQDRAWLLGAVTEREKQVLFNGADIYVQPGIKIKGDMEGFGLVNLEAAACGLPVVAARLEGIEDSIHDDKNGQLVTPEEPTGYVQAINQLARSQEQRQEEGRRAREYTRKNFNWEKVARAYVEEFSSLIKEQC